MAQSAGGKAETPPAQAATKQRAAADKPDDHPLLRLSGALRQRYEYQSGRFRAGLTGDDDVVALRSNIRADLGRERLTATLELMDARVYGDDAQTPINTSQVNPLDILQAHITYDLSDAPGEAESFLRLGRQTVDLNSRRFLARNGLRNTINAFNGIRWRQRFNGGAVLNAVGFFTVGRRPQTTAELRRNDIDFDEENFQQAFWGAHLDQPLDAILPGASVELAFFGLNESDDEDLATANRNIYTPVARLYRKPAGGRIDFDLEAAYQFGERRASRSASDTTDETVDAWFVKAEIGYQFDSDWHWRLSAEFDYASGDRSAGDGVNNRFDTLFGVRVRDFGNSGIFGPFARENILAPGARISFKHQRFDGRVKWTAGHLASNTDLWRQAGLVDPTGQSGSFAGHDISSRFRYWAIEDRLRLQLNISYFIKGGFATDAPNAPQSGDIIYTIVQSTWVF